MHFIRSGVRAAALCGVGGAYRHFQSPIQEEESGEFGVFSRLVRPDLFSLRTLTPKGHEEWLRRKSFEKLGQNIWVSRNGAPLGFSERVREDLATIGSKPVGKQLLAHLYQGKHLIFIHYYPHRNCAIAARGLGHRLPGVGSSTSVLYNPWKKPTLFNIRGKVSTYPAWTSLAHELLHAYHNQQGTNRTKEADPIDRRIWKNAEEYQTILGLESQINQYAILKEHGLTPRYGHVSCRNISSGLKRRLVANAKRDFPLANGYLKRGEKRRAPKTLVSCQRDQLHRGG